MDLLFYATIILYLLSTAWYIAYLCLQKNRQFRTGYALLISGFAVHTIALFTAMIRSGRFPAQNLHETLSLAGWAVVCAFLVFQHRYQLKILGVYVAPLAAVIMVAASKLPREALVAKEILNNAWLVLHIGTVFIGEASLALACGVGCLYLLQEHAIKSKRPGFFFRRLPSLDLLDSAGYACIVAGFTLVTVGLITGIIYAKVIWGRFWNWDPKEIWSAITWLLYAALLHQRLTVGWRGRKSAIMAIIGFCVVLFTFLGVNFLLQGHHGEFTQIK